MTNLVRSCLLVLVLLMLSTRAFAEVRIVSSLPGSYVDISAVGTAFNLGDDGSTLYTTSVGNSLLPPGTIRISNNGAVAWNNNFTGFSNTALPSANLANNQQALAVFWDDLFTYARDPGITPDSVYVAEIDGTLYITWQLGHIALFPSTNPVTIQLQVFSSGPILAQFVYQDVDFGDPAYNNGASATIGYQAGGVRNDAQWSFNAASIVSGTVLSVIDPNAANVSISDNIPGKYVDISSAGNYFNLGDDGSTPFVTSIGNGVLPPGVTLNISNNGAVGWGGGGTGFGNTALPSNNLASGTQALAVFWDDLLTYGGLAPNVRPQGVYVAERNGVLYITWRLGHFANTSNDSGLIQLQVFSSGPVYAQYIYLDTNFANGAYDDGASATVGYQSGGSGSVVQYSLNQGGAIFPGLVLSITEPVAGSGGCGQDFNGDGEVNGDDLADYINVFFGGCP